MNLDVENEILFHIENELSDRNVDARQLLNQAISTEDGYLLRVYGRTLRFNEDGDLIE